MRTKHLLWLVVAVGLLAAAEARATTYGHVYAAYAGTSQVDGVTVTSPGYNGGTYVGEYQLETNTGHDNTTDLGKTLLGTLYVYCVDLYQTTGGWYTYTISDLADAPLGGGGGGMGATKAAYIHELYARWYSTVDTVPEAAAFGAMIWEIVNEDVATKDWVLDKGNVQITGLDDDGYFATYKASLDGASTDKTLVYALWNDGTQDFALVADSGGLLIPEPLTLTGMFLGVGGLAAYIRRRRSA